MSSDAPIGKQLLQSLKLTAGGSGPPLGLLVGRPAVARLRPVATSGELLNATDVACLTEWRNRFVEAFLTEFQASEERTATWLRDVVGPDDGRILFMVDDLEGKPFGYMAVAFIDWGSHSGEADAVVRGGEAAPGVMSQALSVLMNWARSTLGLKRIGVRVRSDNPALSFYEKFGFEETHRVPLRKEERPDGVAYTEDPSLESNVLTLVHMNLPN